MKSVGKALLLLVTLLGVAVAGVALLVMRAGVSARDRPGATEVFVARSIRNAVVARHARALRDLEPPTAASIAAGRAHFADHCASCHANDGSGETSIGQGLWPKAPDMRREATQSLSDGELFYIIENGVRFTGMPGWATGTPEGERQSWHLVHFIRHLPHISEQEIEEMEQANPRAPADVQRRLDEEAFLRGEPDRLDHVVPHSHPGGAHD